MLNELVAYLSRLTGQTLSAERSLGLRSVQRAALAAWARKRGLQIRFDLVAKGEPVRICDLLTDPSIAVETISERSEPMKSGAPGAGTVVGIDMEDISALPLANDYREHSFFQGNFTQNEIAYCVRQADARASFCGLWAAKEAIVKAGLSSVTSLGLAAIEIGHDMDGRPVFAGAGLSISHTATTAVAICIASVVPAPLPMVSHSRSHNVDTGPPQPPTSDRRATALAIAACFATLTVGGLSIAMHLWQ